MLSPLAGRLADRFGPAPVLLVLAVAHPIALIGLIALSGSSALPVMYAMSALAGATYPPLTAAIRGAWARLTEPGSASGELRQTALAAETSIFEIVFVVGPLLVAAPIAFFGPAFALGISAVVTLIGTGWVATRSVMRQFTPHHREHRATGLGPLGVPGFPALLACVAGLGAAFGSLIGRLAPGAMRNEAYTWAVTIGVSASAVGGAVAGVLVDRAGGVPMAFVLAAMCVAGAAAVTGLPQGSIARADAEA